MGYEAAVAALTPRLFYKMNETSGTVCTDSGALGVNGTYTGGPTLNQAALYAGGKSVSFDGTDDYMTVATSAPASWTAISACAWVVPATANDKWVMNLAYNGGSIPLALGLGNGGDGNGSRWNAGMYSGSWNIVTDSSNLASGQTYFIAATITASGQIRLYVNSWRVATLAVGSIGAWTSNEIRCGRRWDSGTYSSMRVAGLAIWNSQLTDSDIFGLYNSEPAPSWTTTEGEQQAYGGPDTFLPIGESTGAATVPTEGQLWPRGNRGV